MVSNVLEELKHVFSPKVFQEAFATALVLNSPTTLTKDMAKDLAGRLNISPVMYRIGTLAAEALADGLESLGLRPADYVQLDEISSVIAGRLSKELKANPEVFMKAFVAQLGLRG